MQAPDSPSHGFRVDELVPALSLADGLAVAPALDTGCQANRGSSAGASTSVPVNIDLAAASVRRPMRDISSGGAAPKGFTGPVQVIDVADDYNYSSSPQHDSTLLSSAVQRNPVELSGANGIEGAAALPQRIRASDHASLGGAAPQQYRASQPGRLAVGSSPVNIVAKGPQPYRTPGDGFHSSSGGGGTAQRRRSTNEYTLEVGSPLVDGDVAAAAVRRPMREICSSPGSAPTLIGAPGSLSRDPSDRFVIEPMEDLGFSANYALGYSANYALPSPLDASIASAAITRTVVDLSQGGASPPATAPSNLISGDGTASRFSSAGNARLSSAGFAPRVSGPGATRMSAAGVAPRASAAGAGMRGSTAGARGSAGGIQSAAANIQEGHLHGAGADHNGPASAWKNFSAAHAFDSAAHAVTHSQANVFLPSGRTAGDVQPAAAVKRRVLDLHTVRSPRASDAGSAASTTATGKSPPMSPTAATTALLLEAAEEDGPEYALSNQHLDPALVGAAIQRRPVSISSSGNVVVGKGSKDEYGMPRRSTAGGWAAKDLADKDPAMYMDVPQRQVLQVAADTDEASLQAAAQDDEDDDTGASGDGKTGGNKGTGVLHKFKGLFNRSSDE